MYTYISTFSITSSENIIHEKSFFFYSCSICLLLLFCFILFFEKLIVFAEQRLEKVFWTKVLKKRKMEKTKENSDSVDPYWLCTDDEAPDLKPKDVSKTNKKKAKGDLQKKKVVYVQKKKKKEKRSNVTIVHHNRMKLVE
ncbi:hypothetical protein RFI_29699 [Reticulomyxa filosa]|uniref:Uncharacterized protein n=1 Tax=Reticulomyxa filosa TaxID=46433 RepID=X6M1C1_RETFI|nr:hypothetical protein RFI_29699 [Reticulomyxa filosa]|eukprot:ETO07689.1 hypothetical protein RFI_29699 [Reticulomyxa filosa]